MASSLEQFTAAYLRGYRTQINGTQAESSEQACEDIQEEEPTMRQFMARVECPSHPEIVRFHAIEFYLQAPNIVEAAAYVHDVILPIGFDDDNITKLIEVQK